jgi:hypothetical protein
VLELTNIPANTGQVVLMIGASVIPWASDCLLFILSLRSASLLFELFWKFELRRDIDFLLLDLPVVDDWGLNKLILYWFTMIMAFFLPASLSLLPPAWI